MKTGFALILAAAVGLSSFTSTSAYERSLNEQEERGLGWSNKLSSKESQEKAADLVDRCCGDEFDTPTNSWGKIGACNCPVRGVEWFHIYSKWQNYCESSISIALANPDFSTLAGLVYRADLQRKLGSTTKWRGLKDITLFAPNNAAFEAADLTEDVLAGLDDATITTVLQFHVYGEGVVKSSDINPGETIVNTLAGKDITINNSGEGITVGPSFTEGSANVIVPDIMTSNGVIHVIDNVLSPL